MIVVDGDLSGSRMPYTTAFFCDASWNKPIAYAFPGLTMGSHDMMMQGMRFILCLVLLLAACAMKPPAQEMSDARSAIKTAHQLPGDTPRADRYLQSAEKALDDAVRAISAEQYERARSKALEARRNAQEAARIKQLKNK